MSSEHVQAEAAVAEGDLSPQLGHVVAIPRGRESIVAFKFGGTSLSGAKRMLHAASLVRPVAQASQVVVVVSAMKGVTDRLLAIEEGRRMFDNIQKFILHLLTSNVAEVILLIVGLAFQDKSGFSVFPLSPLQILWINMLTSSFPAFGLGREKAASDILRRPPHGTREVRCQLNRY